MTHIIKHTNPSRSLAFMLLLLVLLTSCEDFVDIDPPNNQLTSAIVFEDAATVNAALTHVYGQLRDQGLTNGGVSGLGYLLGHYTDELTLYSTSQSGIQLFFDNNVLATDNTVLSQWNSSYNLIYATNNIIEGVKSSTGLAEEDKDQFLGEAYFIRTLIHFYLVNLFGDIPYIDTTDYRTNSTTSRLEADQVYQKMIDDLVLSKSLLSANYGDANRVRPNKWVATALLARVYLYNENWDGALSEATEILSSGVYALNTDINQVFLKNSTETLLQFDAGISGANTIDALTYIFTSGPPPNSSLADYFIDSFEVGDARFSDWMGTVSNGTDTWYYPFKYKLNTNTRTTQECSILFRLAELYLISAEANAQLGNVSNALDQLNVIRERSSLAPVLVTDTAALLETIYQERKMEFFTEMGHRFFDLKRTSAATSELSPVKPNWQATDVLLPIPESELLLNPNLKPQNDGY
ncbi:RagB/SusD family nutrient uptake outer membrane protein [Changchengzhania lutea]|uniref:RagB/SusD family nutrient uptake outer membrane protein n=1 Tax=Changchengzhania lutea TaxID=2049305 RepID=UPI00115DD06D|nr:RagB/SusD family nutrient uptake outer membrane protein [Changchengzhania lutea]